MAYTAINKAADFMNSVTYTGTGAVQTITGVGFQPDFTWIKERNGTDWHSLVDTLRGYSKWVYSNANAAEATFTDRLTSWNSDGFVLGAGVETNTNTSTYVGWNWKAGTTTGIDTTGSTITPSSYSFNATSGFSVIAYTGNGSAGALIPHGLGVAPKMIIIKRLDTTNGWAVYHSSLGNTKYLGLDETTGETTASTWWNDTSPTSILFTVGTAGDVNTSTGTYIAYCFADVKGYSQFGSYTGNGVTTYGSTDVAPFIYTGFKPSYVMCKYVGVENWAIVDNKRLGYNPDNHQLYANATNADVSNLRVNMYSNGFKVMTTNAEWNGSGNKYIYAAFGQTLVGSNGVVAPAR